MKHLLAAVVLLSLGCSDTEGTSGRRPDVLLISIDTLRADHLPAYGSKVQTAPTLSRLGEQGVVFANSYSQAPSTSPTHASMFTGRLPLEHGVFSYRQKLVEREITLAEHLSGQGYATLAVTTSIRFVGDTGLAQGFERYVTLHDLAKNDRSSRAVDVTLQALSRFKRETGEGLSKPFFAFVHLFDPHEPYAPPEPFRSHFHPVLDTPIPEETSRYVQGHNLPNSPVPAVTLDYLRGLYDGAILYVDREIERLLAGLESLGVAQDTLVIVTSDHGEEFKEHGGLSHSERLFEEVLRVPLIVRWPGRVPAGVTVHRPVQSIDLLPTICDLVGVPKPPGLVGRSMADALVGGTSRASQGPSQFPRDVIIVQQNESLWGVLATFETGRFKLINDGTQASLYRLDTDPGEREDLRTSHPAETAALRSLFADAQVNADAQSAERAVIHPEEVQRLRDLGYLGDSSR